MTVWKKSKEQRRWEARNHISTLVTIVKLTFHWGIFSLCIPVHITYLGIWMYRWAEKHPPAFYPHQCWFEILANTSTCSFFPDIHWFSAYICVIPDMDIYKTAKWESSCTLSHMGSLYMWAVCARSNQCEENGGTGLLGMIPFSSSTCHCTHYYVIWTKFIYIKWGIIFKWTHLYILCFISLQFILIDCFLVQQVHLIFVFCLDE